MSEQGLTVELRWFFDGDPQPELIDRFLARGAVKEERSDSYLQFEASRSASVKRREGRLEAKVLVRSAGVSLSAPSAARGAPPAARGVMEWWEKRVIAGSAAIEDSVGEWVEVKKRRWLAELLREHYEGVAVGAEITGLEAVGKRFWTTGFEATADQAGVAEALIQAAETLLVQPSPAVELSARNSMSYPEWLLGLASSQTLSTGHSDLRMMP